MIVGDKMQNSKTIVDNGVSAIVTFNNNCNTLRAQSSVTTYRVDHTLCVTRVAVCQRGVEILTVSDDGTQLRCATAGWPCVITQTGD